MTATRAMMIAVAAVFCGCLMDALIKYTAGQTDALLWVIAWRYLAGAVLTCGLMMAMKRAIPGWQAIRFHTFRGVIAGATGLFFFYGLTQLALIEGIVLGFSAALMIGPIAWILLGERISPVTMAATLLGFGGVALATLAHPEGAPPDGNRLYGTAAILAGAFGYALSIVLLRMRADRDDSLTIVTFQNVIPALLYAPFLFAGDMALFTGYSVHVLVAGVLGVGIWWLMSIAYANAPAQTLAPLEYTSLIWSSLLGWLVFSERPGWLLFVGAFVIIIACLIVAFESHFRNRRETHQPVSDILD